MNTDFYGKASLAIVPIVFIGHFMAIQIYMNTPWDWKYTPLIGLSLIGLFFLSALGLIFSALGQVRKQKYSLRGMVLNMLLVAYQLWFAFFQRSIT